MAWVKLDDQFMRHPKVVSAGRDARDLYLAGLCYCGSGLTDGLIPSNALRILGADADIDDPRSAADALVREGLWEPSDDGYLVHDYHEYNPTREKVLETRAARAEAGSRGGKQKASNLLAENEAKTKQKSAPYPYPDPSLSPGPSKGESAREERDVGATAPTAPAPTSPTPKQSRPKRRPTEIPDGFQVTDDMRQWAAEHGYTQPMIEFETEKFVTYWQGSGKTKQDWSATWRNWLLNARERPGSRASPVTAMPRNAISHSEDETIDWTGKYGRKASNE